MRKVLSFILVIAICFSVFSTSVYAVPNGNGQRKTVGDIDFDSEITDWDGVLLARHLAGWTVTVTDTKVLDIDGDGEITDWDGVMFDRHLAGWSVSTQAGKGLSYSIAYVNTKNAVNTNPAYFENSDAEILLAPISAEHYTFDGWYIGNDKITHIPTNTEANLTITAKWTPIAYTLSYANTKGAINNNPEEYHIECDNIILQDLECAGYQFEGWYMSNEKVSYIPAGTTGNIGLSARWKASDYTISYENTKGSANSNPCSFTTDSDTILLHDLEKEGYTFDGWYNGNQKITEIPSGTIGDITLVAQWTPISYSAIFVANGSEVALRYFTIEDSVIPNIPNVPAKPGYTGAWSSYTLTAEDIVIPAIYTLDEYTISYANTKGAENYNPITYTITTDTFSLLDLYCVGYDFVGWYRGNTKISSIEKGTIGNVSLTAKWEATDYIITYSDTKGAVNSNPTEYNIETGTIYLADISAEHYIFKGWYLNDSRITEIPSGNTGDLELVAHWTPISYDISYKNTKASTNTNPISYTTEDHIILSDLSADGYVFEGWFVGDNKVDQILPGSYGIKELTARWSLITYSITYLDTKGAHNQNATVFTIESEDIILSDISKDGYVFDGWEINGEIVEKIPTGTFGDLEITALWTPNTYTLTYISQYADITNANPKTYNTDSSFTLDEAIFDKHHTFEGWFLDPEFNTPIEQINGQTMEDLTLYAKWSFNGTYIASATEFMNIMYAPAEAYELIGDITISTTICDEYNPFTGYFYGNDFTISGVCPFGVLSGTVMHLKTERSLADENNGILSYCIGGRGLVVVNTGDIFRCGSLSGQVKDSWTGSVAGLVVKNSGTIRQSYSKGDVTLSTAGGIAAGLVADNQGTIEDSYALGDVSRTNAVGSTASGLVGNNAGDIIRCYAAGKVTSVAKDKTTGYTTVGTAYASGLVHGGSSKSSLKQSFYAGDRVSASSTATPTASAISAELYYMGGNFYSEGSAYYSCGDYPSGLHYGTATAAANFRTPGFIKATMGWSEDIWRLANGQLPALAWE